MRRSDRDPRKLGLGRGHRRKAAAALELALLMPMLSYVCVVTIDYSRLFFFWTTIAPCALNGAYYLSDSNMAASSGYSSYQQAALADASNLSPAPTVSTTSGTDSSGNAYVTVTVSYAFQTLFNYPGIPSSVTLSRKVQMAVTPP